MPVVGTGSQRGGRLSRVLLGVTPLYQSSWSANWVSGNSDITNFENQGLEVGLIAVQSVQFNFGGDWDATGNYFANPPGIFPRDDLANLFLIINRNEAPRWTFACARIRSATVSSEVHSAVSFQAAGASQGTWLAPGF